MARASIGVLLAATLVWSAAGLVHGETIRPSDEAARRLPTSTAVLDAVGLASHHPIEIGDDARSERRDLRLRARVEGHANPALEMTVAVSQYDAPGGAPTPDPLVIVPPVKMALSSIAGSRATYAGSIDWASLRAAGRRIPLGQSALLCIRDVIAGSGSAMLPASEQAASVKNGRDCVRLTRSGSPIGANRLLTAVLSDVVVEEASPDGRSYVLSYAARSLSIFGDRPVRTAKTIPFGQLTSSARWRGAFRTLTPTVQVGIVGSEDLGPVQIGIPQALGSGRYRSEFVFAASSHLPAGGLSGLDLAIFANGAPAGRRDPSECDVDPFTLRSDFVPPNADFLGRLRSVSITAEPGRDSLELAVEEPQFFSWFLSRGADCKATFTGPIAFERLASAAGWSELFGTIDPNSALVWQDGSTSHVFEFEQGRPRFDPDSGRWISEIRPLANGLVPGRAGVEEFVRRHGARLDVTQPYLFMDSTNSAINGGEIWNVDSNFQISYSVDAVAGILGLRFTLGNDMNGWMGLVFHNFMFPADCIVAWMDGDTPIAWDCYNPGIPTIPVFPAPLRDTDPEILLSPPSSLNNVDNVTIDSATNSGGVLTISLHRPLNTGDIFDFAVEADRMFPVCAAYSESRGFIDQPSAQQPVHTAYSCTQWMFP